ncbi:MAG TPA: prepilin-type N-terminal cleavage/methylation domain-containing protein [Geopsychrobacteraceae bacterium]|nr:prepilin-type N-terminal cleavage/methylation domain-containing protein [Geopsychrobacteraceae bacterium]
MPISKTGISTDQTGFTLIELTVVISLLAIFSLISLPLITNQGDGGQRRAMRELAGNVKLLYNEAALRREIHLLTFNLDDESYRTYRLERNGTQVEKVPVKEAKKLAPFQIDQIQVSGKGSFRSGEVTVRIYPQGWMEETWVQLENTDKQVKTLNFVPMTGTTRIYDGRKEI